MLTPIRHAMFDFDGTLADSFAWVCDQIPSVMAAHGLSHRIPSDLHALRALHAREIIRTLGVPWWRIPGIAADLRKRMSEDIEAIALFPGVLDALRALASEGVTLSVVTSNAEANVRAVLGEGASLIGNYECGLSLFGKAARFRKLAARVAAAPAQTIAIGDELRDLDAARRVGIPFGAVAWGYTVAEVFAASADIVFQTPADWLSLVARAA